MPKVVLVAAHPIPPADAVVVGVHSAGSGVELAPGAAIVDDALGGRLVSALRAAGATGKADEVLKIPTLGLAPFPLVVATGLGARDADAADGEQLRRAVGAAIRSLAADVRRVHLAVGDQMGAAAEGALFGGYTFTEYKLEAKRPALTAVSIGVNDPKSTVARAALRRARILAEAVATTRDLVNAPPNDLYPETLARRATQLAGQAGLDVEVLDEKALKRGGYGGILGVGTGSARPPRLVRLTYRATRPRARIALVGKGITFDSGGLNLKPGPSMDAMKSDMGGAAAVLTATAAIAALRLPVQVIATVPMAENMISGSSYRPSDVLVLRGGKTLEITNTDAEGRVILADAIVRAVEDRPDYLIETSTLTGAQLVALGPRVIAAMGEPRFRDEVVAAGNATGEALWAMPLPEDLRSGLDSQVADLANLPNERWGGMLVGGLFMANFVPDDLPWVHLDIAGPSWNGAAAYGYTPKGGTGAAVRTIIATVEQLAASQLTPTGG